MTYKTNGLITIHGFRGGSAYPCPYSDFILPPGLRCIPCGAGGDGTSKFLLDQFPPNIFPRNSALLHDAVYYGVILLPDQVEVIP